MVSRWSTPPIPRRRTPRRLAAAALAGAALLAAGAARAELDRERYVALGGSVLRVEAPRPGGGYAMGSAVKIGEDLAVTNCHVTREARQIFVVRGEYRWRVELQASDLEHDICLLRVPNLPGAVVPLAGAAEPAIGQPVHALGYTGGIGLQTSSGEVVALHRLAGGRVIQSTNWFSSGASGGGLFDDQGHLVGVLTFRMRGGEAHYFAAPVAWVRRMVEEPGRVAFRAVAPLGDDEQPYWQQPVERQPPFLRAALLQRDGRWRDLFNLASDWLRGDADDAEPWFLLGLAAERLDRLGDARHALECSLRLEPLLAVARTRLFNLLGRGAPPATERPCKP